MVFKLQAIGHLGKDAELRTLESGGKMMIFNVAVTEKWTGKDGNKQERTTWISCSKFSEKTGILPYLIKGTQVYVEGTPEVRQYTTQDGTHGASLQLRVLDVQLLGGGNGQGTSQQPAQQAHQQPASAPAADPNSPVGQPVDDLPF